MTFARATHTHTRTQRTHEHTAINSNLTRPSEKTLKTQDLGDQAAMETEYSDRQTTEFETSYE